MDTKMDTKQKLLQIIKEKSYREGDFTLASGKKSKFYLDLKETTLHQEGICLVGKMFAQLIAEKKIRAFAVGGLTLGADPIATAACMAAAEKNIPLQSFIVRKQAKDHGTLAWIEGAKSYPQGAALLVVEDVATTGQSALKAVDKLIEAGFTIAAVVTVMDREEGAREAIEARGLKFFSLCNLSELPGKSKG
jgi:orotate phosphoribosyltransferase